ncbi:hypothetical protein [Desulfovibrio sp.]|nr:hypothetical protein [Desulfovibrio sp.]
MPARGDIFTYVREKFDTEPEYPWPGIRTTRSCGTGRDGSGTA